MENMKTVLIRWAMLVLETAGEDYNSEESASWNAGGLDWDKFHNEMEHSRGWAKVENDREFEDEFDAQCYMETLLDREIEDILGRAALRYEASHWNGRDNVTEFEMEVDVYMSKMQKSAAAAKGTLEELAMGVEEAAELWGAAPGYIKNLCAEGRVKAIKIGKTWVIDKRQENPMKGRW